MTSRKQLKARVRERMARTGEHYTTARRHVVGAGDAGGAGAGGPVVHAGYALRGGVHPDTASIANVLAHAGVRAGHTGEPVSEPLVLGVGGGLGAGYILWELRAHDTRFLVLGFRNRWQSPGVWAERTLDRLGVPFDVHTTGGRKAAEARLTAALDAGRPAIVWPDRQLVGYRHLPPHLEAFGGHPVVAYAAVDGRVALDDRTLAPLTVPRERLDAARARVVSYRNTLSVLHPDGDPSADVLRAAVVAGLTDQVEYLAATSESFSLPAWRKWARLTTDIRNAKAWPKVFADGRGLAGALASVWEGVEPLGPAGGSLRGLYADFLDEAADLTGLDLRPCAARYREVAGAWHALAEEALPASVPVLGRIRELTAAVAESVTAEGDAGAEDAAATAAELWALRAEADAGPLLDADATAELFARLGARLGEIARAEVAAHAALARAVG